MKAPKISTRKCKSCNLPFTPSNTIVPVCSMICAIAYSKLLQTKKTAKEWRIKKAEMKLKLLTHKDYLKLLQTVFNTFIRQRDKGKGCISCGRLKCEEFHAGHYIATTYQYLRFNELNCWLQCSQCNTHLRGNSIPYRIELIKRIGVHEVEQLERNRHCELKISIPQIKELIIVYKSKIKELK